MSIARNWVRAALVTAGLVTTVAMAPAAAAAAPASAASFVTPVYGMTCETGVTGDDKGYATCYAPRDAKWKVRVDCSFGFVYDSVMVYTGPADGWYTLGPGVSCTWGVNSVSVIEVGA